MTEEEKQYLIDELEFVRLKIPTLIPIELIENVKGKTFTSQQFYNYQEKQIKNPYNYLYAVVDKNKIIQGFLWAEQNILDGSLFVNTFSISKEYWGKGKAISKVGEFLKQLKAKCQASKVFWLTTNERFFLKHNFRRSKNVLMEFSEDVV